MSRIRVLVVEDSLTIRKRLVEVLTSDPALAVVGEAEDGKRAIELCQALRPSVIIMDMMLPVMTGLAATEYIMAYFPTPILIVSASLNRGEVFRTFDALAAGALDVLEKPRGTEPSGEWERRFIEMVKLISRVKVITHPRARLSNQAELAAVRASAAAGGPPHYKAVAIGASTGGPSAVVTIMHALPAGFPLPILLVIHLSEAFADSFSEWLDTQSALRVAYVKDGQVLPQRGTSGVFLAPPGKHLVVQAGKLHLTRDPERHSCRPSVDTLFESVAREYGSASAACLLTGMGRDGAKGLLAIRAAGGVTIAQDEASSVVFGMPREAIALNAAAHVLPIGQIAGALTNLIQKKSGTAHTSAGEST
jgi:two-component system chemotaxis response regulator CheB